MFNEKFVNIGFILIVTTLISIVTSRFGTPLPPFLKQPLPPFWVPPLSDTNLKICPLLSDSHTNWCM